MGAGHDPARKGRQRLRSEGGADRLQFREVLAVDLVGPVPDGPEDGIVLVRARHQERRLASVWRLDYRHLVAISETWSVRLGPLAATRRRIPTSGKSSTVPQWSVRSHGDLGVTAARRFLEVAGSGHPAPDHGLGRNPCLDLVPVAQEVAGRAAKALLVCAQRHSGIDR